jgi:2-polyprenyl-6-methoxyphenol hydroxylase-like FAD-dependent oxidoreductase
MPGTLQVAIIGGGTAGAATALLLARAGHRISLFERVAEPGPAGAGILLQPTGMRVLEELGLLERILEHGTRIDSLYGTNPQGRTVLDVRYLDWKASAFGLGLHRGALFSVLWAALMREGIEIRSGLGIDRIEQGADKASLFSGDQALGEFDCVVLADGTRSDLRASLAIPQQATPYPWGALWAMVPDEGFNPGVLRQWFRNAEQMLGLMPTGCGHLDGGRPVLSLFWSLPATAVAAWREAGLDAWKRELLALAPIGPVLEHIQSVEQLSFASYSDVRMKHWHQHRVVCIGDCAHATSPQLGQGANLALIDALVLSRCLGADDTVPAKLARYSTLRRAHLRYYQLSSRCLTPFFQSHSRLASGLRDLALGPLCRAPLLRGQMARTLSGTKTGFLWGELET